MSVALLPFNQPEHIELAWGWIQEFPRSNFDDTGPTTFEAFREMMLARGSNESEYVWLVTADDEPAGFIGVTWPGGRLAAMHGICFTRKFHRKGVALEAMRLIMDQLWKAGVERLEAYYFVSNGRVHRFLQKLGFQQEGIMRARTLQGGKPIDVRMSAVLNPARELKTGDRITIPVVYAVNPKTSEEVLQ